MVQLGASLSLAGAHMLLRCSNDISRPSLLASLQPQLPVEDVNCLCDLICVSALALPSVGTNFPSSLPSAQPPSMQLLSLAWYVAGNEESVELVSRLAG